MHIYVHLGPLRSQIAPQIKIITYLVTQSNFTYSFNGCFEAKALRAQAYLTIFFAPKFFSNDVIQTKVKRKFLATGR